MTAMNGAQQGSTIAAKQNSQGPLLAGEPPWSNPGAIPVKFAQIQGGYASASTPKSQCSTATFGEQGRAAGFGIDRLGSVSSVTSAAPSFGGTLDLSRNLSREVSWRNLQMPEIGTLSREVSWGNLQIPEASSARPQYFSPRAHPCLKGSLTANGYAAPMTGTEFLLRDEVMALRQETITLTRDINEARSAIADRDKRIIELEAEALSAKENARVLREEAHDLQRVLQQRENNITELAQRFEKTVGQMEAELSTSRSQNESLQVELRALRAVMLTAPSGGTSQDPPKEEVVPVAPEEEVKVSEILKPKAKARPFSRLHTPTASSRHRTTSSSGDYRPDRTGSFITVRKASPSARQREASRNGSR